MISIVHGRLGKTPEVKEFNGYKITNFNIAENVFRKGEKTTMWYQVSVFGKLGETCAEHLDTGREVLVIGELETRTYTSGSGETKTATQIKANMVKFLGKGDKTTTTTTKEFDASEELPF